MFENIEDRLYLIVGAVILVLLVVLMVPHTEAAPQTCNWQVFSLPLNIPEVVFVSVPQGTEPDFVYITPSDNHMPGEPFSSDDDPELGSDYTAYLFMPGEYIITVNGNSIWAGSHGTPLVVRYRCDLELTDNFIPNPYGA